MHFVDLLSCSDDILQMLLCSRSYAVRKVAALSCETVSRGFHSVDMGMPAIGSLGSSLSSPCSIRQLLSRQGQPLDTSLRTCDVSG